MHSGVTGHRGNVERFPENTLASFSSAIDLGVDWLELDIRLTKDGRLAVIHDADTGRVGGIEMEVASSTFAELSKVDAAALFRKEHGLSLQACPPQRIPLLEDVLRLLLSKPGPRLSIQPKSACVDAALALVKRMCAESRIGFNDGDIEKLLAVKRFDRRIPVFYDLYDQDMDAAIDAALNGGFECIVVHCGHLDEACARKIIAAGLAAGAWTVNDEASMRRFLLMGVERFYTDRPEALIRLKMEMGLK